VSVPTTHHKLALKILSQPQPPVCELQHLGIEVLPILPFLLKKVVFPEKDQGRNARELAFPAEIRCTSSNESLVLAVLLDLHSRRDT